MAALEWGTGTRPYSAGVQKGVLYLPGLDGLPWNGLVSVEELVEDANNDCIFLDGSTTGIIQDPGDAAFKVSAFTYPTEFTQFTGFDDWFDSQPLQSFGFSYQIGDSATGQIHLVYNATAIPSGLNWNTISEQVDPSLFEWDISTIPEDFPTSRPTAHVIIDLATTPSAIVTGLQEALYGSSTADAYLPDYDGLFQIFEDNAVFQIIDNGDGSWTAHIPDASVVMSEANTAFSITWPTAGTIDLAQAIR